MDGQYKEHNILERILSDQEKPSNLELTLLRHITDNFSNKRRIGNGGCGVVYKGILRNGIVAVKRLLSIHTLEDKMFDREVKNMLMTKHHNIVRLLGYCCDTQKLATENEGNFIMADQREMLLCFEYISNGSLDNHLTDELRGLEWHTRYQIIKGICEGLDYLHDKHILHMDLKPANILLDDLMVPKITDFGLSRLDGNSKATNTQLFFSPGYCAPEYFKDGKISAMSDIYSLGVTIIELVTGTKENPKITKVLRRWRHRWNKSKKYVPLWYQQVKKCLELALSCKQENPINRPCIRDIICELKETDCWDEQVSHAADTTLNEIISCLEDMLRVEPLEMHFPNALKKHISCCIELTNDTDGYIAFRIATTSLLRFSIHPNNDMVPPRSKCSVTITLEAQGKTPLYSHCKEKFVVQSTRVDGSVTPMDISGEMFNEEAGKVIDEVNVSIIFDEPSLPGEMFNKEGKVIDEVNLSIIFDEPPLPKEPQAINMLLKMDVPENELVIKENEKSKGIPVNNHNITEFTEEDAQRITKNYTTSVGKCAFGEVYQGVLDDGRLVAVNKYIEIGKCAFGEVYQGVLDDGRLVAVNKYIENNQGFAKEVNIHSQINHKNVVRLLGYCAKENALMMVTEFISGRNLSNLLHTCHDPISLDARLSIAMECAEALNYMHSMQQPIIHGDIKPANILLDDKLGAKLSYFGMSRLLSMDRAHYTKNIIGSIGYMDPEYIMNGRIDPKNDVYSFGVVLLELVTRKKICENGRSTDLKENFMKAIEKGKKVREMFDTGIMNADRNTLDKVGKLVADCLIRDLNKRPDMKDIGHRLYILTKAYHQQAKEKTGQWSLWGAQKINGDSITTSSSNSTFLYKMGSLDIFNRTARRKVISNASPILDYAKITTVFRLKELKPFLKSSNLIGTSYSWEIYKGYIGCNNQPITLMKHNNACIFQEDEIVNEIVIQSQLVHKNIIRMIGCCLEVAIPILVFESASKGSLEDILHGSNMMPLNFDVRLQIAAQSAGALAYMHSETPTIILHGDFKPANILLDDDFVPKISAIGTSRLIGGDKYINCIIGDLSYMDPVYLQTGLLTRGSDVYSFGVVLLELITRKKASYRDNYCLIKNFIEYYTKEKRVVELFDRDITLAENTELLYRLAGIIMQCLNLDVDQRPEMTDVAVCLSDMLMRYR